MRGDVLWLEISYCAMLHRSDTVYCIVSKRRVLRVCQQLRVADRGVVLACDEQHIVDIDARNQNSPRIIHLQSIRYKDRQELVRRLSDILSMKQERTRHSRTLGSFQNSSHKTPWTPRSSNSPHGAIYTLLVGVYLSPKSLYPSPLTKVCIQGSCAFSSLSSQ